MIGDGSYIDGLCYNDETCCSNHSHCKLGLCRCLPGYVPSVDNRKCIGKSATCCPAVVFEYAGLVGGGGVTAVLFCFFLFAFLLQKSVIIFLTEEFSKDNLFFFFFCLSDNVDPNRDHASPLLLPLSDYLYRFEDFVTVGYIRKIRQRMFSVV